MPSGRTLPSRPHITQYDTTAHLHCRTSAFVLSYDRATRQHQISCNLFVINDIMILSHRHKEHGRVHCSRMRTLHHFVSDEVLRRRTIRQELTDMGGGNIARQRLLHLVHSKLVTAQRSTHTYRRKFSTCISLLSSKV